MFSVQGLCFVGSLIECSWSQPLRFSSTIMIKILSFASLVRRGAWKNVDVPLGFVV